MLGMTKTQAITVGIIAALVVIADIFGILYLQNRTRDITVLSEISQIRSALEVYRVRNSFYPRTTAAVTLGDAYAGTQQLCNDGFHRLGDACTAVILARVPDAYGVGYQYRSLQDGADYQIQFTLSTTLRMFGFNAGTSCATSAGLTNQSCF